MADKRNRILPTVYRTGDPVIDRNLDSIFEAFRRLSSAGDDDHEVKADDADTGHDSLFDKLKDTATLTWSVDETLGIRRVKGDVQGIPEADDHLIKARIADTTTVGGAYDKTTDSETITREVVTENGVEKVKFNAVPPTPTTGGGSWLYTGSIQADNLKDPVKAFVKATGYGGGLDPGNSAMFTVLENGDLEHKDVGQLYGLAPNGTETFVLAQGQRVWCALTAGESNTSARAGGICTVLTLGNGSTKAVLRPVTADMVTGATFKVEGSGAEFENWYWEIDTADSLQYWIYYKADYVNETTFNLLTSTEVSRAGSTLRYTEVTIPGGSSGWTNFATFVFEMLSGVNLSVIPKGGVNWEVYYEVVDDDPTATIAIRAFLSLNGGTSDNFAYAESTVHSETPTVVKMQAAIPADIACSPTDKLSAVFYAYSSSASPVTIRLYYNSPTHATRVQTPVVTGSWGTLDHKLLDMLSKGWVAGQEKWAGIFQHPEATVCSRFPVDCSATIETGDGAGVLVIPENCSGVVRVTGTELRAIAVKDAEGNTVFGKLAGLRLHFVDTCTVRHLDALSGLTAPWLSRAAKLHLLPPPDSTGTDMDLLIPALRTVRFYLDQPSGNLTWIIEARQ